MANFTRKDLYNLGGRVYYVGYCDAQYLLKGCDKIGSNSGVYGWNFSVYKPAHDIVINTGYRNLTGIDAREITREYEKRACDLFHDYSIPLCSKRIDEIRSEWLEKLREL